MFVDLNTDDIFTYFLGKLYVYNGTKPDKDDIAKENNIQLLYTFEDSIPYCHIYKMDDKYGATRINQACTEGRKVKIDGNLYYDIFLEKHLDLIKSKIKEIEHGN